MQPSTHRRSGGAEAFAEPLEGSVALVLAADEAGGHEQGRGEDVRLLLDVRDLDLGPAVLLLVGMHGRLAAEQGALAVAVEDPVAELVADREAAAGRPLAGLLGLDRLPLI